jgi:hypothetical protein
VDKLKIRPRIINKDNEKINILKVLLIESIMAPP